MPMASNIFGPRMMILTLLVAVRWVVAPYDIPEQQHHHEARSEMLRTMMVTKMFSPCGPTMKKRMAHHHYTREKVTVCLWNKLLPIFIEQT